MSSVRRLRLPRWDVSTRTAVRPCRPVSTVPGTVVLVVALNLLGVCTSKGVAHLLAAPKAWQVRIDVSACLLDGMQARSDYLNPICTSRCVFLLPRWRIHTVLHPIMHLWEQLTSSRKWIIPFQKKRKRKTIIRDGWIKKGVLHAKW
jgi:hypothetical protein